VCVDQKVKYNAGHYRSDSVVSQRVVCEPGTGDLQYAGFLSAKVCI
jgi:hypothetical protein